MLHGMEGVVLSPELEQFATEEVAAGHYRDLDDVVRAGLDLLKQRAKAREALLASVLAAQDEGDRCGLLTGGDVAARVRRTIARRSSADH